MSEQIFVTDSMGRSIEVVELGIEDQFDLIEVAGESAEINRWVGMAALVFAARSIDGKPLPRPRNKADVRRNAATLKTEGFAAIAQHFQSKSAPTEEAVIDAAKN
ncbi:MAG: hypothetical protein KGL35_16200 [Bradyrhizobium sp.]|nr:hypothetical protein [Bradyrhizobium sp.]